MRLTNQTAAALRIPAGKKYVLAFDDELPGFGIRVSEGGSRVWVVQYRNSLGQSRRETLGKVGLLSATEARKAAADRLARARLGGDPHAERAAARARAEVTIGAQVERYLAASAVRLSTSYLGDVRRYLTTSFGGFHKLPVDSLTRAQVSTRLNEITQEAGPHAANQARAALSRFYVWMIGEGIAEGNPVVGSNKPGVTVARERVLSNDELAAIWKGCQDDDFGRIVKLLLLTGQRREEVSAMAWAELDLAGAVWSLPGERTKNGRSHDVPLSAAALSTLSAVHQVDERELVFGRGEGGFSGFSRAKDNLDKRCGVTGWRLHDLRRTAATGMAGLGVLPHVIEAVLNHVSGHKAGVAGIYNRATYAAEKREALDKWATHVAKLTSA